jgi:hypothetical protein
MVIRGGVGLYQDSINLNQITANLPTTSPVRLTLTLRDMAENHGWGNCFYCGDNPWTGVSAISGEPDAFAFTGTQGKVAPFGFDYPSVPVTGISSRGLALNGASTYQTDMYGVDPKLKPQSTVIWNFGVEQELPNSIVVGATYTGSYSYNQFLNGQGYNAPPSIISGGTPWSDAGKVALVRNQLSSNYNALVLTATQRKGNLSWQGNFLWSHALGNPGTGDNPSPYTATAAYGTTNLDVPLRLTVSGVYEFSGGNSPLTKGWSLGGIFIGQEGTPFTVYSSQDVNGDGNHDGSNDLPNIALSGTGAHYGRYSNSQFKAGIFSCGGGAGSLDGAKCPFKTVPTTGSLVANAKTDEGNEPYNAFRNPGYWDVDLNLQKKFEVPWFGEQKAHLNLRLEAMNAFNHANLNGFGSSIVIGTTSNFGAATSAENPRILQIGGRFEF